MISLLAQAAPDPLQLAGFLMSIAFLLGIAVAAKKLFQRTPTLGEEFVTRREFKALEARLDDKIEDLSTQIESNNTNSERRVVLLHNRINALPTEIINLLRSTKGLLD